MSLTLPNVSVIRKKKKTHFYTNGVCRVCGCLLADILETRILIFIPIENREKESSKVYRRDVLFYYRRALVPR